MPRADLQSLSEMWAIFDRTIPFNASEQQRRMLKDAWVCGVQQFLLVFVKAMLDETDEAIGDAWLESIHQELQAYSAEIPNRPRIVIPPGFRVN